MAQPLFKRLRERHTKLILDVLAPHWTFPLLRHMPEVNDVIANPFGHGELALRKRYELGKALRGRRYHQAIILPNSFKSALVPFFARIPVRTGFVGEMRWGLVNDARSLDKQALPLMVERFAALAEAKGHPLARPIPKAHLVSNEKSARGVLDQLSLSTDKPVAAFCVGAEYGPAKRWPAEHFAGLAQALAGEGYAVWLVGSAKDKEIGARIERKSGGTAINLCGKTTLSDAINLLGSASLVVSNDSGLMHVAAALGKPMIALYGSSSPGFTPPISDNARVLSLNLSCSPCFKRECPLGHFNCMMQLTPDRVLQEVHALRGT